MRKKQVDQVIQVNKVNQMIKVKQLKQVKRLKQVNQVEQVGVHLTKVVRKPEDDPVPDVFHQLQLHLCFLQRFHRIPL